MENNKELAELFEQLDEHEQNCFKRMFSALDENRKNKIVSDILNNIIREETLINIGIDDLKQCLKNSEEVIVFNINSEEQDTDEIIKNNLKKIKEINNVIICVICSTQITLNDISTIADKISFYIKEDTNVMFGVKVDDKIKGRKTETIILATGNN